LISVFTKINAEDGSEFYSGTMNPIVFKKAKEAIEVILMPATSVPRSIVDLLRKSGAPKADVLMFGAIREEENKPKGR
jgi:hypothetical protein